MRCVRIINSSVCITQTDLVLFPFLDHGSEAALPVLGILTLDQVIRRVVSHACKHDVTELLLRETDLASIVDTRVHR